MHIHAPQKDERSTLDNIQFDLYFINEEIFRFQRNFHFGGTTDMKTTVILILVLMPVAVIAQTYRETRNLELPAAGVQMLIVRCGAGRLIIQGFAGTDTIRVSAEIESKDDAKGEFKLLVDKLVKLELIRDYNKALIYSDIMKQPLPDLTGLIHLNIAMPAQMNLKITDGSGSIHISDIIGDLEIADSSGVIRAETVTGQIHISDGSGDIDIEDVTGTVDIDDGSGEIVLQDVTGDVKIKDASGGIEIHDVGGSVTVSDGSGLIDIYKVQKNVLIHEAGTGDLHVEGVKGKVMIREYKATEPENSVE